MWSPDGVDSPSCLASRAVKIAGPLTNWTWIGGPNPRGGPPLRRVTDNQHGFPGAGGPAGAPPVCLCDRSDQHLDIPGRNPASFNLSPWLPRQRGAAHRSEWLISIHVSGKMLWRTGAWRSSNRAPHNATLSRGKPTIRTWRPCTLPRRRRWAPWCRRRMPACAMLVSNARPGRPSKRAMKSAAIADDAVKLERSHCLVLCHPRRINLRSALPLDT